MRIWAAIFVAALSMGAVPIPEIVGAFNAGDLRPGELTIPEGVTVTSTINPANGVPVVRVDSALAGHIWVPLFRLPAAKIQTGEIRYRMTFDTEAPANCVQPGVRITYESGDSVTTPGPKNFSQLKLAVPPLFTSEGHYWNDRKDPLESAVFGVMLYGPGVVRVEQAQVMAHTEPFRGFTLETLLLMCIFSGVFLIFAFGFLRIWPSAKRDSAWPVAKLLRCAFATLFILGFFVLPQWESDWTVPFILSGAIGFLVSDLPFLRQSDGHV